MSIVPKRPGGVLGTRAPNGYSQDVPGRGGGMLPTYRTTYSYHQRLALWRLAESNPSPEVYQREKARILEGP
jgi:hypothetical protein